jgi:hypothetical protein
MEGRLMPGTEQPQVRVEILGANAVGKSVVAQLLRAVLRAERITTIGRPGPDVRRPSDVLRQSIADLRERGLSVEIIETETAGPIHPKHQIDAAHAR